jgi:hypothetical protein
MDPYEERSLPKVDYKSLEWRMYHALSACYSYLDENDPKQKALKQLCNDLPREYEERAMRNHKERN